MGDEFVRKHSKVAPVEDFGAMDSRVEEIRRALMNLSEDAKRTAEVIGDHGRPLDSFQRNLVRVSGLGMLREAMDILQVKYMQGESIDSDLDRISWINQTFSDFNN